MARGNGGTVSLRQPEVSVLRRLSWKPCVLVLRAHNKDTLQDIIGVAVDDTVGGGDGFRSLGTGNFQAE